MTIREGIAARRLILPAAVALFGALPAVASAAVTFGPPTSYAAGLGTQDVAIGDFNRDGKPDIATANQTDNSVSILLGNGDGTFQAQTRIAVATGAPKRVAVADFDGDGNDDLALAIADANRAAVYWGTGTGTGFDGTYTVVSTPGNPGGVGGADLGYGYDQLLATNPAGIQLSVYTADPAQRVFGAPVNTVVGNGPDAVASGNLYGETDVVVTFPSSGSLRFERGDGHGGLQPGVGGSYGVGSPPINGGNPTDVAVADLTGDGKGDMVTSNIGTNTATILPSRSINVSAQQNTALPSGTAPTGITTGDFTGDGIADAAVVGSGTGAVTVLKGGAPGVLTAMTIVGTSPAGSDIGRAEGGDFNGDGVADLAVSSVANGGEVRVLMSRGTPTLAGEASASVQVGGNLTDTATLSGATPNATGTITFRAYGPGDTTCATVLAAVTIPVSGNGAYTSSPPLDASHAGTYRWVASYSGDASNDAVGGTCADANQTTVVAKKTTSVSVSPSASITLGANTTSQTTLSSGVSPTGTIVVRAYATSDCSGSPAYTSSNVAVTGNGTYSVSPAFTPAAAGTYRWTTSYSGDGDNEAATSACGASGATTTVAKRSPTLSATAASPVTVGTTSTVSATLAGGHGPTGTVTFAAYTTEACTGTPAYTSDAVTVDGNDDYSAAPPFVPDHAGTYRWIASYTGDANNEPAETGCGDAGTVTTVARAEPSLAGAATGATLGAPVHDTATLTGATTGAGGTVVFTAYANAECTGPAVFTSDPVTVDGNGEYGSGDFTPNASGQYRWVATYSGDGDNAPAETACGAEGQTSTVTQPVLAASPGSVGTSPAPAPPVTPTVKLTGVTATRCLGTAKRAKKKVTVSYTVSAPSKVTFTLQRRVRPADSVRTNCPKPQPAGVAGSYVDVRRAAGSTRTAATAAGRRGRTMTRTVAVGAGKHRFALASLLGSATLEPGRFRVLIQVVSDRGARTQKSGYFWVLKPAKKTKR